jgi:mono/diheme cytochrome c family protein
MGCRWCPEQLNFFYKMRRLFSKPFSIAATALAMLLLVSATGCYYDKEEILYPATACDTTVVTYSTSVVPILSANCFSCHGGNTPSAAIRLDTYAGVKQQADNGRLFGAVSHDASYSPMPKGGTKLNPCNIAKIRKWIAAGAPNN